MSRPSKLRAADRLASLGMAVMSRIRIVLANGKFWSGMLAAASLSRGTAFIERPPSPTTIASGAIEAFISYPAWGVVLLATAAGIGVGHMHKRFHVIGVLAHLASLFAYATFALSVLGASVWGGESWASLGLLAVQSVLHFACAIYLADQIARFRQEVRVE